MLGSSGRRSLERARGRSGLLLVLLVFAALALSFRCGRGQSPGNQSRGDRDQGRSSIAYQVEFRRSLGLNTHRGLVEQLQSAANTKEAYGAVLTAEEYALIQKRTYPASRLGAIIAFGDAHPKSFAGALLTDDGAVVVYAVDEQERYIKLGRELGLPKYEVRDASRSLAKLEAEAARIRSERDAFKAETGHEIVAVDVNVLLNVPSVGVANPSPEVVKSVRDRFGRHVEVKRREYDVPL